jgi:hypothetical protein
MTPPTIHRDILGMSQEDMVHEIMWLRSVVAAAKDELKELGSVSSTHCGLCEGSAPRDPDGVPVDDIKHADDCIMQKIEEVLLGVKL